MLMNIFSSRNDTVSALLKLSECLGRSLRENVALFLIEGEDKKVSFVTESDKIIEGSYILDEGRVSLRDIEISDSESYKSGETYDDLVSNKIHSFVKDLGNNAIQEADTNFEDVLKLWNNRLQFDSVKTKLEEKASRFDETLDILKTQEFSRLQEITPNMINYLAENAKAITDIPEIFNACRLSNTLATAFDVPRIDYAYLSENTTYDMHPNVPNSVFDMICRQELVKKELLESKKDFDVIWATNETVKRLSGLIFESDETVLESLAEAIEEVPYLALVSKATLNTTIKNSINFDGTVGISDSDVKAHAARLFEFKKPIKKQLIDLLNENYGINIQNLKEPASFKSLLNTQVVIFETLSRISPKGSVQRKVLSEMSEMLKYKAGVESIDVNDYIFSVLHESGLVDRVEEAAKAAPKNNPYVTSVDMRKVGKDLKKIGDVFGVMKQNMQYSSDENLDKQEDEKEAKGKANMDATDKAMGGMEAQTDGDAQNARPPVPEPDQSPDEMVSNMSELEGLIDDLAGQLGMKTDAPKEDDTDTVKSEEEE